MLSQIYAQEDYFNLVIDLSQNSFTDVANSGALESGNGYIITGYTKDTVNSLWCKAIGLLNYDGSVKQIKNLCYENSDYIAGNPGSLIKFSEDKYYSIGTKRELTTPYTYDRGMLICHNNQMDPLWSILYGEKSQPYDTAHILKQVIKTTDDFLVMIGTWKPVGLAPRIWMIKTDSQGKLIWERSYGSGIWYYKGHSVIQTTDNGYAIGGFNFLIGNEYSGDPILIKTDSLGNQEWEKNLGGRYKSNKAMICLGDDGKIIVGTNYTDYTYGGDPYGRVNVIKLDNLGNILWDKKYGGTFLKNYLQSTRITSNGDIICLGSRNPPGLLDFEGWILRLGSNGDSLWLRNYRFLFGEDSHNRFYDIIELENHRLFACGSILPVMPDTGSQDAWVIKLDSLGCEYPFCDTTVGIPIVEFNGSDGLSVYPNPAVEMVTFEFQKTGARGTGQGARISVYDYFGRKAEEIVVPPWQERIQMNVSSWNAGVYVAVLWGETGIVGREKFVVVHKTDKR